MPPISRILQSQLGAGIGMEGEAGDGYKDFATFSVSRPPNTSTVTNSGLLRS